MKKTSIKYIFTVLVIFIITTTVGIAQVNGKYGGIAASVDNPPSGTNIDTKLSEYYGVLVAIGNGNTYWHIGGWGWFNQEEMMNLPSGSLMYNISPYDCEVTNGCGGDSSIYVPINIIVIIGFIGFVLYKYKK